MYTMGNTAQVRPTAEKNRYDVSILGVSECRWSGFGTSREGDEENGIEHLE